ncbi:MAG: TonB-dependent receptor, partial [Candidatus Solibacter sp.]
MRIVSTTTLILFLAGAAFAQGDRGTLTGTVTDPAQAAVPAAKLTLKNSETGASFATITTPTGNYTVASLPIGSYDLTVEAPGFKREIRQGIRIQVAQNTRIDIELQVGATTDSVTVSSEAPMLKTENAEVSMNVSGDKFNQLPLNFGAGGTGSIRSWMAFATLAPGVNGDLSTDQNTSVNGLPGGIFKILVEGTDVTSSNDTRWTSTVAASSVEAIGEFSLQTSNFSAQYGGGLGAMFNFTTKSGTNKIHGSLYDYLTNETMFNAHRFFQANRRDRDRKTDAGGTIGGPVYIPKIYNGKDKTFFFFNFEAFRNTTVAYGLLGTVPTAAYRNGDFSAALTNRNLGTDPAGRAILENVIYDPSTESTVGGRIYRNPFPNNVVPKNLMDPVSLKMQALFPAPTNTNLINNWTYDQPNPRIQNLPSLKVDHNIGSLTKLTFYWSYQSTHDVAGNDPLPYPITAKRDKTAKGHTYRMNVDRTITPTFLVHLGAGFLRFNNPDSSQQGSLSYDAVKELGLNGATVDPAGFPRITGLSTGNFGGMSFGMGPTNANDYWNDKLNTVLDLTYIRDKHTYKAGAQFGNEMWSDRNTRGAQGIYGFSNAQTGLPALQGQTLTGGSVGLSYASFLLGMTSSAQVNAVQDPQWRKNTWNLYLQDNWKITRRLTLDYGIRWDLQGVGHEIHYRNSMFGPDIPNPSAAGRPGAVKFEGYGSGRCNCDFTAIYPYALSPRLSLAYQIDNNTVLRAGWGVSYGPGPNWWYVTNQTLLGVGFDNYTVPTPAFDQAASFLRNGLTYDKAALYTPTLNPGLGLTPGSVTGGVGNYYDPHGGRPPRINQWNIALQREFFKSLAIEAAYVGNRGVWEEANNMGAMNYISEPRLKAFGLNLNNAADRDLLTRNLSDPLVQARGFGVPYAGYPTNRTLAQSLRPFPQFTNALTPTWAPLGSSWYDSLQMKATKRYSHGLDATASFTWQKTIALGNGANNGAALGGGINDMFNRSNQRTLSSDWRPLTLVVAFNYRTPRATENKIVKFITGDWTLGGIMTYRSGAQIAVPASQLSNMGSYTFQNTRYNVSGQPYFNFDP